MYTPQIPLIYKIASFISALHTGISYTITLIFYIGLCYNVTKKQKFVRMSTRGLSCTACNG